MLACVCRPVSSSLPKAPPLASCGAKQSPQNRTPNVVTCEPRIATATILKRKVQIYFLDIVCILFDMWLFFFKYFSLSSEEFILSHAHIHNCDLFYTAWALALCCGFLFCCVMCYSPLINMCIIMMVYGCGMRAMHVVNIWIKFVLCARENKHKKGAAEQGSALCVPFNRARTRKYTNFKSNLAQNSKDRRTIFVEWN